MQAERRRRRKNISNSSVSFDTFLSSQLKVEVPAATDEIALYCFCRKPNFGFMM
jgi:hypothetical protein